MGFHDQNIILHITYPIGFESNLCFLGNQNCAEGFRDSQHLHN